MSNNDKCFFCSSECGIIGVANMHRVKRYNCEYCGKFLIGRSCIEDVPGIDKPENKFKIACILNEGRLERKWPGVALSDVTDKEKDVRGYPMISASDLLDMFPQKASDLLNRALLNLSRLVDPTQLFERITLHMVNSRDYLHLFMNSEQGCIAFLKELASQGYIRFNETPGGTQDNAFFLTMKLFEAVESSGIDSKQAFVAMWFDKSMYAHYDNGICKAIEEAGYEPMIIRKKDYNGKVCDEIIAEIKRSKFLVADVTGERNAVFFEAGFAKGLGMEVIYAINEDDVEKLDKYFDTRQYNHIVYSSIKDLYEKLYNRIRATIV